MTKTNDSLNCPNASVGGTETNNSTGDNINQDNTLQNRPETEIGIATREVPHPQVTNSTQGPAAATNEEGAAPRSPLETSSFCSSNELEMGRNTNSRAQLETSNVFNIGSNVSALRQPVALHTLSIITLNSSSSSSSATFDSPTISSPSLQLLYSPNTLQTTSSSFPIEGLPIISTLPTLDGSTCDNDADHFIPDIISDGQRTVGTAPNDTDTNTSTGATPEFDAAPVTLTQLRERNRRNHESFQQWNLQASNIINNQHSTTANGRNTSPLRSSPNRRILSSQRPSGRAANRSCSSCHLRIPCCNLDAARNPSCNCRRRANSERFPFPNTPFRRSLASPTRNISCNCHRRESVTNLRTASRRFAAAAHRNAIHSQRNQNARTVRIMDNREGNSDVENGNISQSANNNRNDHDITNRNTMANDERSAQVTFSRSGLLNTVREIASGNATTDRQLRATLFGPREERYSSQRAENELHNEESVNTARHFYDTHLRITHEHFVRIQSLLLETRSSLSASGVNNVTVRQATDDILRELQNAFNTIGAINDIFREGSLH